MLHATRVALAIGMACTTTLAEPAIEPTLAETTVTATRTPRLVDDVPGTVTVIRATDIEKSGTSDTKDVFRHELDVTVRAAPSRFTTAGAATGRAGNEGINIRGLEGNQVLILVDGIRVPNAFSFGSFATDRGDLLAPDTPSAIEVLRGPASPQYGSDGLAGVVSLRTLEPADLLKSGQEAGGFVCPAHRGPPLPPSRHGQPVRRRGAQPPARPHARQPLRAERDRPVGAAGKQLRQHAQPPPQPRAGPEPHRGHRRARRHTGAGPTCASWPTTAAPRMPTPPPGRHLQVSARHDF